MKRFTANYIFTISGKLLKNGIVETDDSGTITNVIDTQGQLTESRGLAYYNGVIVPGFINSHCHLELSELKNRFESKKGLPAFLENVFEYKRSETSGRTIDAIELHDELMYKNGIVAVGDISNNENSIPVKKKSKIFYYNFIEAIGLNPDAQNIYYKFSKVKRAFDQNQLQSSIVPHAPYSVSSDLFKLIKSETKSDSIISIHNQETESETEMFLNKSGDLFNKLKKLGVYLDNWEPTKMNSLESVIDKLPLKNNILFVHNTFSTQADIELISKKCLNPFWCLCPKSNLYIENTLPNIRLFLAKSDRVVLGTDSLASNNTLSILDEIKTLQKEFPELEFVEVIKWATINGAKALNVDDKFGSIELGKKPGLNLITNFDFVNMKVKEDSQLLKLI